jgi:HEAT repeat protein
MDTLRTPGPACLIALLSFLASSGCSSGPEPSGSPGGDPAGLDEEIRGLDSQNPRERAHSRDLLLAQGRGVARALGRELSARVEAGDTGPGFAVVVRLLGAFGGPDALESLRLASLKRSLDPALRVEAVRSLGMTGSPACVPTLVECAGEGEPIPVRLAAAAALAAFTATSPARETLKSMVVLGPEPVREEASRSLLPCEEEDLREFYLVRLVDRSPAVRLAAVDYFRRRPCPEAAAPLSTLARADRDLRVVIAAGKALEEMSGR